VVSGEILYTSKKLHMLDQERGREQFSFTRFDDGSITLRAYCHIDEPDPSVARDVVYSLDAQDRPLDCFVRLMVGGQFMGAGLFRMFEDRIECESFGPAIGRISQSVRTGGHYDGFGTHPIVADAYMTRQMDLSLGPHKRAIRSFMPSADHRGASAPLIAETRLFLEYLGEEEATVAAGAFHCRRFRFSDEEGGMVTANGAHPPYDFWVTADDDAIFVKGGVGGYMQTWYELVSLTR
jgi:hypothetical protein